MSAIQPLIKKMEYGVEIGKGGIVSTCLTGALFVNYIFRTGTPHRQRKWMLQMPP